MTLESNNNPFLCKVFLSSLQGPTLSWFHYLPTNSVHSFCQLFETFATHHLCSVRRKQSVASLFHVKMNWNESIRNFIKRFGGAILQLNGVSMDTVMWVIKEAIHLNAPFFNSISLEPPHLIDELFQYANCYAMLEDDLKAASQRISRVS